MKPPRLFYRQWVPNLALLPLALLLPAFTGRAVTVTWDGGGTTDLISNAINWSTDVAPVANDTLSFAGSVRLAPDLSVSLSVAGLNFASGASAFIMGGLGTYTINTGGITNNSTSLQTINNNITLGASQSWNTASGDLAVNGIIGGTGGLTKIGTGILTLTGLNTFTGGTTLSSGTLLLGQAGAVGTGTLNLGAGTLDSSSGALTLNNALTVSGDTFFGGTGDLTFTGAVYLSGHRMLTVNAGTVTLNGVITSSNGNKRQLIKDGSGTLVLGGSNANTYRGATTVKSGTLALNKTGVNAFGSTSLLVGDGIGAADSAVLRFDQSGQIPTSTALTLAYDGQVNLQTFNTTIASLTTTGGRIAGTGNLTLGGNITATAAGPNVTTVGAPLLLNGTRTFTINNNSTAGDADFSANGVIGNGSGGANGIIKAGTGTLLLGAANTYTGLTTVNAGTLAYGVSNAINTGGVSVLGGILDLGANRTDSVGQVILDSAGQITGTGTSALTSTAPYDLRSGSVSIPLAGSVGLTKSGTGTVSLAGMNTYTGATSITGGTLSSLAPNSLPANTALTVATGTTLALNNFDNNVGSLTGAGSVTLGSGTLTAGNDNGSTIFSGIISGTGGFIKTGIGEITLSGANTFTGATLISAGTLKLGAANVIADASPVSLNVSAGAVFNLNNFSENIGSLAGGGSVQLGSATVTTGGNNSSTAFSGIVSGTGSLIKTGSGTLTLSGGNSFSGATTVNQGRLTLSGGAGRLTGTTSLTLSSGTGLTLDNSAGENADRLPNTASISLNGTTFTMGSDADGTTENVGQLIPSGGSSNILVQHAGSTTQTTSLIFSSLGTVASGATVNFNGTGGTLGSVTGGPRIFITGQTPGLIGGWATVGSDSAEYTTLYGVSAFTSYYTGADGINVNNPSMIVQLTGTSPSTGYTLSNAGTTTDLGLNLTDAATVDLGTLTSRTLNLKGGGLLKSTATATNLSGEGRLTAGGTLAGNLAITVTDGSTLAIASSIINNAGPDDVYGNGDDGIVSLSKADPGLLTLSGNNTYTGSNFLNNGTVRIAAEANLGSAGSAVVFGGGALEITTGFTAGSGRVFGVTADQTGTLNIASDQTLSLDSAANRLTAGNAAAVLTKAGAGTLVVPGANAAFDGILKLDAGTVELRNASSLGDAISRGQIQLNGGTLKLRQDVSTAFGNNVIIGGAATIDVDRFTGATPAVIHTMGTLEAGAQTLTVSGANGASLVFGNTLLTGAAVFNPTTAPLTLGAVSGSAGFTKTGAALLLLNGGGSYSGATAINGGTLRLGVANGVAAASSVSISSGAVFDLNGLTAAIGSLGGAGNVTMGAGSLTAGGNGASTSFSGIATGTGSFTKTGTGVLTVAAAQAWTGATTAAAGTLRWGSANVLADASALTIAQGATADLSGFSDTVASLDGAGELALGGGTLTTGGNHATTVFSGTVSGGGNVVKTGSGVLTLSGSSSFTGSLTVQTGAAILEGTNSAGAAAGGTVVASGAELRLGSGLIISSEPLSIAGTGISAGGALQVLSGSSAWNGPVTLTGAATVNSAGLDLTLGGPVMLDVNLLTLSGSGDILLDGAVGGSGGISKAGAGILVLRGANTYTGATNITAGTLLLGNVERLHDTTAVTVASGATLDLDDQRETIGSLAGAGIVQTGPGAVTTSLLKFGGNNASTSFSGNITGTGSIEKAGTGVWSVSANNAYTGRTTISGGTVNVSGLGSLAASSSFDIRGGTLLLSGSAADRLGNVSAISMGGAAGSVLSLSGTIVESTGALTLAGSSVIDFGSGSGKLTFANSNAITWTGNLAVWNWTGSVTGGGTDQLNFGGGGLTVAQAGSVTFFQDSGTTSLGTGRLLGGGELVPVPEPGAIMSAGLLFLALTRHEFRRRRPAA